MMDLSCTRVRRHLVVDARVRRYHHAKASLKKKNEGRRHCIKFDANRSSGRKKTSRYKNITQICQKYNIKTINMTVDDRVREAGARLRTDVNLKKKNVCRLCQIYFKLVEW